MNTKSPITAKDLAKEAPHSPRERIAEFAIAARTTDKCRAKLAGTLGEYHYDCPLDNMLFQFKGINGQQFQTAVEGAKTYAEIGVWLQTHGVQKTPAEIKKWSDETEAGSPLKNPEARAHFTESCQQLGLDPKTTTTFAWLEADDHAAFSLQPA